AFRQSPSLSGDTSTGRKPSWPIHVALKPVRIGGTGQPPRATLRPQTMIAELVLPRVFMSLARAIEPFWQVGCRNSRNLDFPLPYACPVPVKSRSCTSWFGRWSPDPPGLCDRRRCAEKTAQSLLFASKRPCSTAESWSCATWFGQWPAGSPVHCGQPEPNPVSDDGRFPGLPACLSTRARFSRCFPIGCRPLFKLFRGDLGPDGRRDLEDFL